MILAAGDFFNEQVHSHIPSGQSFTLGRDRDGVPCRATEAAIQTVADRASALGPYGTGQRNRAGDAHGQRDRSPRAQILRCEGRSDRVRSSLQAVFSGGIQLVHVPREPRQAT